jgi:hypothetical protein
MLIEIFENHNNQLEQLAGKDCAPGTLERYQLFDAEMIVKSPISIILIFKLR